MKKALLSFSMFLVGCGGMQTPTDGGTGGGEGHHHDEVTELKFAAKVGTQDFACGNTYTLGTTNTEYKPRDLRFYVSDVVLTSTDDLEVPFTLSASAFQGDGVALIDFEDATGECSSGGTSQKNTSLVGTAEGGHYKAITFTLGIPFAKNHVDATAAAAPLNSSAMFWSWNSGFKFMKIDGVTTGLPMGHNLHVGSTGCMAGATPNTVSSCTAENRARITVTGFNTENGVVVLDLAKLFEGSDLDTNQAGAPGCMSGATDPECAPIFQRLGLPFGGNAAVTQTVFSATTN
ncbi:MAG: MbnP family copper-binding protein [Archangium sp.]